MKEQTVSETFWQTDGAAVPEADAHARMTNEVIKVNSVNWVLAVGRNPYYDGGH